MEQTFSLRLAESNDIDALTELHWASFHPEEHIPVMLGRRYVRAAYKWQVSSEQAYTLIAETNGKIVGLIAVCDRPFTLPMFKACFGELVLSLITTPSLLLKKKLWARLFRRPDVSRRSRKMADYPGFAQMTIGAVDAHCRGQNIFPALVEATKTISRSRGSRAIRAGVYKNNSPSRRVFIKGGWIETPELETKDTVFYVAYLDPKFPDEIGIKLPNHI